MPANLGLQMAVTGDGAFKSALSAADAQIKALGAQLDTATSRMEKYGGSEEEMQAAAQKSAELTEALKGKIELLNKARDKENTELQRLGKALEEATDKYGVNSAQAQTASIAYNKQSAVVSKLDANIAKTTKQLDGLGRETKETTAGTKSAADAVDDLGREMGSAGGETGGLTAQLERLNQTAAAQFAFSVGTKVVEVLAAIAQKAFEAGKALFSMARESATWADDLITQSTVTGISTDKLQEYAYAARFVDTEVDTVAKSMAKMTKGMAGSGKDVQQAFKKLGVVTKDASGNLRDTEAVFWDAIDALGRVKNETERNALAMTIFGKSAMELNPLIEAGSEAWNQYCAEARDAGVVLGEDAVKSLGDFDDAMQRNSATMDAAKRQIAAAFAPAFSVAADAVTALSQKTAAWANTDKGKATLEKISNAVLALAEVIGDNIDGIIDFFAETINIIGDLIDWLIKLVKMTIQSVNDIIDWFAKIPEALSQFWEDAKAAGANLVKGLWEGIKSSAGWLWDKVSGWASGLVRDIKGVFGIHSPSTVMRDEVGQMMGRGLALGLLDSAAMVQSAYNAMLPDITMVRTGISAANQTVGSFGSAGLGDTIADALRQVVVMLDGERVGQLVMPSVGMAMGRAALGGRFAV